MKPAPVIAEFIGTYFLMLVIGLAAVPPQDAGAMAPLGIAAILIGMIYMGGHISKAHYNPAITLAFFMRKKIDVAGALIFVVAQFAAAAAAVGTTYFLKPDAAAVTMEFEVGPTIVAEALFTFALAFVILNVAIARGTRGNQFYGVAIGLTVLGAIHAVGPISGAALNPAVTLGLGMLEIADWIDLWMHLSGQLVGAVAAALIFGAFVPQVDD